MARKAGRPRTLEDQDVMIWSQLEGIDRGQAVSGQGRGGLPKGKAVPHGRSLGGRLLLPIDVHEAPAGTEEPDRLVHRRRGDPMQDVREDRHVGDRILDGDALRGRKDRFEVPDLSFDRSLPDQLHELGGDIDRVHPTPRADHGRGREGVEARSGAHVDDDVARFEVDPAPEPRRVLARETRGGVQYGDRVGA